MTWPTGKYGAIYATPPWGYQTFSGVAIASRHYAQPYSPMSMEAIAALPVSELAAENSVLFCWVVWPTLPDALEVIKAWGFTYKTCGFAWIKANVQQQEMFRDDSDVQVGMGYWTRANSEVCLLATRGKPKRLNADVRQAIVEPRRQHSRKPACVYDRIERLVDGPYLELFARNEPRPNWTAWGNEVGKFAA